MARVADSKARGGRWRGPSAADFPALKAPAMPKLARRGGRGHRAPAKLDVREVWRRACRGADGPDVVKALGLEDALRDARVYGVFAEAISRGHCLHRLRLGARLLHEARRGGARALSLLATTHLSRYQGEQSAGFTAEDEAALVARTRAALEATEES